MVPSTQPGLGEKPPVVRRASRLLWLAWTLGILRFWLDWLWHPSHLTAPQARLTAFLSAETLLIVLLAAAVFRWIFYGWLIHAMDQGKNRARVTRLVLWLVGAVLAVLPLLRTLRWNPSSGALWLIHYLLTGIGVFMLFTRGAKPWFLARPRLLSTDGMI